ncbi:hypothetical protein, partial [Sulfitobacter sp. KE12]
MRRMLPPKSRLPLPPRAIPTLIAGQDTRAQAAENRRRITDYLELLRQQNLSLPAAPKQPNALGIARIAEEAGVSLGVLRPQHPLRQRLEEAIPELGLAIIVEEDVPADQLSIAECRSLFAALAPARAVALGMRHKAMQEFIDRLFDLLIARARNDQDALALPLVRRMQREAQADLLDIDDHVRSILEEFDDWVALRENPGRALSEEALASMAFRDLLLIGMEQTGLSQGKIAALCHIPQPTVWKWLVQGRAPNVRSYPALRVLSRHFGFPEETLIRSISHLKGGKGVQLPLALFPEQYRERRSHDLRKSVKSHLTEDDFQLSDEALSQRIARLCEQIDTEREPARHRKLMRDINRIDRSRFSPCLREDLERYRADLAGKNRSPQTQASYCNHLEGFFNFALSSNVPISLRPPPGEVEFAHVASLPLWEAYFSHLTGVGRRTMGQDFLISRAMVERMKAVSSLFDPDRGFMTKNKVIFARVLSLDEQHLPVFLIDHPQILMREIHQELARFRSEWMRKSQRPTKGRDEISDILSHPDPMIAVRQIISHLRLQKSQIRKWMVLPDGGAPPRLNHHYATASRRLVLIHLLGQTALRIGMVPKLTVGEHTAGAHLQWTEEKPVLNIPAKLFKNGASEVFKEGPYQRVLENIDGVYDDLREYLDLARPRLLDGAQDDRLFLGWNAENGCRPAQAAILRNEITQTTREAIGLDAPPDKRLIRATHLRPHHFRDILATTVLHRTNRNYALAGDAIHV